MTASGLLVAAWRGWRGLAHKIGNVQARLLLSVFYFVPFAPFALGLKLLSDPLALRSCAVWRPRPVLEDEIRAIARRQF